MNYEQEIQALSAETLALSGIFVHILGRIAVLDPILANAIQLGFDDAASDAENTAIKFGKAADAGHTVKVLAIIESLRTATIGNPDEPKHSV